MILLALGIVTCRESGEQRSDENGPQLVSSANDVHRISIVASEMNFSPARAEVMAGSDVIVELKNEGTVLHDWNMKRPENEVDDHDFPNSQTASNASKHISLDPANHENHGNPADQSDHNHEMRSGEVHLMAKSGEISNIKFRAEKPGIYEFYCSVPGHREAGMVGVLYVK